MSPKDKEGPINRRALVPEERVTLIFKNREERDFFMGQLSDGWGENEVSLKWDGDFYETNEYRVDPTINEDLWEHHRNVRRMFGAPAEYGAPPDPEEDES